MLSILCVVSWFVLVGRILATGDHDIEDFIFTYLVTTTIGIVGGIIFIFVAMLKRRRLKNSFAYNLFGTFNIIIGLIGLAFASGINPTPYIASACLGIGVVIYNDIYRRKAMQQ